ncbi:MAG TPA: flavodoxin domain-containing protein [Actinomycetota bacterium]|nr:flavodoxin domain-containing protein [Actinomycetota bacterium]
MKIVVVFESMFGNTQIIAEAIAEGLAGAGNVTIGNVDQIGPDRASDADLIVVGGPTHVHGMPRLSTRYPKENNPEYNPPLPGAEILRNWIDKMPKGSAEVATFDTRFDKPAWLTGSAAKKIARKIASKGYPVVAVESFFVVGGDGPLADGERERAIAWARELAGASVSRAAS